MARQRSVMQVQYKKLYVIFAALHSAVHALWNIKGLYTANSVNVARSIINSKLIVYRPASLHNQAEYYNLSIYIV